MTKLADQFHERMATISFESFDGGQVTGDSHPQDAPLYVIAILPRSGGMGTSQQKLHRMIKRLRRAVGDTKFNSNPVAAGVCFVQFGNAQFGHPGMSDIESCTAAGFARALHLESPSLEVRIIDMATSSAISWRPTSSPMKSRQLAPFETVLSIDSAVATKRDIAKSKRATIQANR